MLEEVKQYGLEKFAGDETLAYEFVEGFVKAATEMAVEKGLDLEGLLKEAVDRKAMGPYDAAKSGFAEQLGRGGGGLAMNALTTGIMWGYRNMEASSLHSSYLRALEHAIANNRIIREADQSKVKNFGATIARFAPHIATDANILVSLLSNALHGDSIDPMTIKALTDLEGQYIKNHGFSPKNYV